MYGILRQSFNQIYKVDGPIPVPDPRSSISATKSIAFAVSNPG